MKRPILCMFCTQSVVRGLTSLFSATQPFSKQKTNTYYLCSTALCVCVCVCVCVPLRAEKATSAVFQLIFCVSTCVGCFTVGATGRLECTHRLWYSCATVCCIKFLVECKVSLLLCGFEIELKNT